MMGTSMVPGKRAEHGGQFSSGQRVAGKGSGKGHDDWGGSEGASFNQSSLSSSRNAKHCGASNTDDDGLSVAEKRAYFVATWALDVHEEGVRMLHETLEFVLLSLLFSIRVQQITGQRHF